MRTRPHYIGEFQLQIRRHIIPGAEKRMTKKMLVEIATCESSDDSALLEYMSHFGQVIRVLWNTFFDDNPKDCAKYPTSR